MLDAIRLPSLFASASPSRSTVELPLTPPMRAALAEAQSKARRKVSELELGGGLFLLLAVFGGMAIEVVATALVAAAAALAGWAAWSGGRDLRRATYRRTSGPLHAESHGQLGTRCQVGDRVLWIDELPGAALAAISPLPWATVEYTDHQRFIFEVRDADGRPIYRAPEYAPSGDPGLSSQA